MAKSSVKALPLMVINTNTLASPLYVVVPGGPTTKPVFMVRVCNNSDRDVLISFDGVTAFDASRSETDMVLNFQANAQPAGHVAQLAIRTSFYILGAAGGTGVISFACYYQDN